MLLTLAALAGAIWVYLRAARGGFWRADSRLPNQLSEPPNWPDVVAVVPARDEAPVIGRTLQMLLEQDYPGALSVIVVDDHSGDGTATVVDEIARGKAARGRLTIIQSDPLPAGWAGKVWALAQGVSASAIVPNKRRYLLRRRRSTCAVHASAPRCTRRAR